MAYDIVITRRLPGESWDRTLERIEQSADMMPPRLSAPMTRCWERAANRIAGADAEFGRGRVNRLELTVESPTVRVIFEEHSAFVSIPHAHGAHDATSAMTRVAEVVSVICEESGWSAYDQQLECEITDSADLIGDGARHLESAAGTLDRDDDTTANPKKRWWRFGT